jgi:hypothetical protein
VIAIIDGFEDQRTLFVIEKNFRKILKTHMQKLLEARESIGEIGPRLSGPSLVVKIPKNFILLPPETIGKLYLIVAG